jgi:hypothetical protein
VALQNGFPHGSYCQLLLVNVSLSNDRDSVEALASVTLNKTPSDQPSAPINAGTNELEKNERTRKEGLYYCFN